MVSLLNTSLSGDLELAKNPLGVLTDRHISRPEWVWTMQRCAVGLVEDVNCSPEWSQSHSLSWYQPWVWNTRLEETMFCLVLWLASLVYHSRSFMKVFKWMKLVSDQHVRVEETKLNYTSGHIPLNVQWSSHTLTSKTKFPVPTTAPSRCFISS